MASYEAIVRSYRADAEQRKSEAEWWSDHSQTLVLAIHRACLSAIPGRKGLVKHRHQRRIAPSTLKAVASILVPFAARLEATQSFDDLHNVVVSACRHIKGVRELFTYDVSHRLGLYLGLRPERVYLHRGTRDGAKALGIVVSGRKYIELDELPEPLQGLLPEEAEDVLCIYKSRFKTG